MELLANCNNLTLWEVRSHHSQMWDGWWIFLKPSKSYAYWAIYSQHPANPNTYMCESIDMATAVAEVAHLETDGKNLVQLG